LAPSRPESGLHSLPPILGSTISNSIPSCSKAPRGLFVLLQVDGIFTVIAISPSSSLRQLSTRYAFHAGQNLPVKEFRYLRTIIVIADVHWRFGDWLAPLPLTFQHWSGVSPHTSPCGFAETCVFDKQSVDIFSCAPTCVGESIFLSYGRFFAEFLNEGSLVHLRLLAQSTCVGFSTVSILLNLEVFPGTLLVLVPFRERKVPKAS
jgi:hypothetical protein